MSCPSSGERSSPGLRNFNHLWFEEPERVFAAVRPVASVKHFRPGENGKPFYQFVGLLPINHTQLMCFGSADVQLAVEGCPSIHLVACFAGTRRVRPSGGEVQCIGGGVLLLPPGDRETHRGNSKALFRLEPSQIAQAAAAMAGVEDGVSWRPSAWWRAFQPRAWARGSTALQIHALIRYIDACMAVDPALPAQLGLDDVLHRQVASLLDPSLLLEGPRDREGLQTQEGKSAFDDLLDYIRQNLGQPLRLSDLEDRSHYSRRALQYAFRHHLHCTPKQWIRQERLKVAMEQLREGNGSSSVRTVALGCGYRSLSLFSADFKRQFGCTPSLARRGSLEIAPPGQHSNPVSVALAPQALPPLSTDPCHPGGAQNLNGGFCGSTLGGSVRGAAPASRGPDRKPMPDFSTAMG